MLHLDFDWDLNNDGIKLDPELNINKLDWKVGDYFQLIDLNGKRVLKKLDPLEKFLKDGESTTD